MKKETIQTTTNVLTFLKALASSGNVTRAAESIGTTRSVVYYWKKTNAAFSEAWDNAIEKAMDELEESARDRALHGPRLETLNKEGEVVEIQGPPSDGLTKFLLEKHRYNSTVVEHRHRHELSLVNLTDAQLHAIAAKAVNSGEVIEAPPLSRGVRNLETGEMMISLGKDISGEKEAIVLQPPPVFKPEHSPTDWLKAEMFTGKK